MKLLWFSMSWVTRPTESVGVGGGMPVGFRLGASVSPAPHFEGWLLNID